MLCQPVDAPRVSQDIEAHVCWFDEKPMKVNGRYVVKHTTNSVRSSVKELAYRLDINTLEQDGTAHTLEMNQIGRIRLRTSKPLCHDPYSRNRGTGSFILIDEGTNRTVAAGMIL
jgi:bifunctional enzyme CysN/CysC